MARASTRHLCFKLNKSASNFVTLANRLIYIRNQVAKFDLDEESTIDELGYSYSSDFSALFLEGKIVISSYETDGLPKAIDCMINYFNQQDWSTALPEPLKSLYTFKDATLPTKNKVVVEKEPINNRITITHRIEFIAKLSEIKRVVNTYLTAQMREPTYFTTLNVRGVFPNTVQKGKTLHISTANNVAKVFYNNNHDNVDPSLARQHMIFTHGFLNFANNSIDNATGFHHSPVPCSQAVKLNLSFHTMIEMLVEYSGMQRQYSVSMIEPVIKSDRIFFSDLDLSEHLNEGFNKTVIKKSILEKACRGTKIIDLKITSMKRKVAVSNYAKYQHITYIGMLFGYRVIAEIRKDGMVKVSELDGGYFYIDNARERLERGIKSIIHDLFSNDREYASYLFYKTIFRSDTKNSFLLFS